ncbi:MAG TPA: PqqD family protein [Allosphingosinicella sp.]|nr:PqqD family protein [Allosphingosinicella sp.]
MFTRSRDVVAANFDDKTFLLHVQTAVYLELNETGLRVWELLEDRQGAETLVDALRREFDVPEDVCAGDVAELLSALQSQNFVISEEGPAGEKSA